MDGRTLGVGLQDHCDGITAPEPIDDDRVTDYSSDGVMANFTATASGNVGTYTWEYEGWADAGHRVVGLLG